MEVLDTGVIGIYKIPKNLVELEVLLKEHTKLLIEEIINEEKLDKEKVMEGLKEFSELVVGMSYQMIPEETDETKKRGRKPLIAKLDDWRMAKSKDDLESFSVSKLKNILSENGISATGTKSVLVERVWILSNSLNSASESKNVLPLAKKRGRPPKTETASITTKTIDTLDKNVESLSMDDLNPSEIELSDETLVDIEIKGKVYKQLIETNWLFSFEKEILDWAGYLEDDEIITFKPKPNVIERMMS